MDYLYTYSLVIWLIFSISFNSFFFVSLFGYKVGSNGSILFICSNSICLLILSLLLFVGHLNKCMVLDYNIGAWFSVDLVNVSFGIKIDALSSTMLVVITTISLFAQAYSIEYMSHDPHKPRFFAYLSLFTFFMLVLVCSNNLFLMFVGWEGVGICSYLLINFWYFRVQANKSAILAVTINKVGDLSFLVAISIIQFVYKTTELSIFNSIARYTEVASIYISSLYTLSNVEALRIASFATLFFIIACVGKSAQLGLHLWLPEAMEGPTPVSSLIHAATMVTAGIYLVLRVSFLLRSSPTALTVILLIGALTTLFAASIGLVQVDIKKIVAYSTCSQLGYMFMGCGYKGFNFVIFHLFIHAFFKALLFLTAGYLIHLLVNEQDTRKMGGLLKTSHFSYVANTIGSLALIGFPSFSGFFSKEKILEGLSLLNLFFVKYTDSYDHFVFLVGIFSYTTLIITILYSFKVLSEIFFGRYNGFKQVLAVFSYSELYIITPLFLLSMLSIYSGYFFSDAMVGISSDFWFNSFLVEDRFFFYNASVLYSSDLDSLASCFSSNNTLLHSNTLSEFEWEHNQWVVPTWTLFYLFCIFSLRYFFLKKTRYYLFRFLLGSSKRLSFFSSLVHKYVYINRVFIVPVVLFTYYSSYNFFYRVVEKGILESVGGYGIYNLLTEFLDLKTVRHTFLLYHYLGLLVISLFLLFFLLVTTL